MHEIFACTVNIDTLKIDVENAFQFYRNSTHQKDTIKKSIIMTLAGNGRIAREFIDYLVQGIGSTQIKAIALVRNDLFIQFLVSSINLRSPQTTVKAFKTDADAKAWLSEISLKANLIGRNPN